SEMNPVPSERLPKGVGIAELRVARKLTQEELAERLNVGVAIFKRARTPVETGRQDMTLKRERRPVAAKLRAPALAFFESRNTKMPPPGDPADRK
ncbi:MAG TPA: helix-turn-helix transcriptional regulator, partial [Polyangiaceae bacterium]|nr:helix-turn-helix transcriptional regulator [Polyangiaceae bacterium]